MREFITVERNTATGKNAMGEKTDGFTTHFTAYAEANPLDGDEAVRRGLTVESQPVEFVFRYRADKSPADKDRIDWRGSKYDVRSVAEKVRLQRWSVLAVRHA